MGRKAEFCGATANFDGYAASSICIGEFEPRHEGAMLRFVTFLTCRGNPVHGIRTTNLDIAY